MKSFFSTRTSNDTDSDPSSTETLLPSSEKLQYSSRRPSRWSRMGIVLLILASHLLTATLTLWISTFWRLNLDSACARHTTRYSPVLKDVDIKYTTVTYNGSFFHETIYRRDPSPEVDEAWQALGVDYRAAGIPRSEAAASGLADDQVKVREKYGGYFPANVEGLHHLHCLNLLRQTLLWNYDYYSALGHGAFKNEAHIVKVHATHCLDILRQQLMCNVDTGVLGQVWTHPDAPSPFVDFNTQHRCKNYDAVRAWAERHQLPPETQTPKDYLEPPTGRVWEEIP